MIEQCTPILDIPKTENIKYKTPLLELLQKLHEAGANHRDAVLSNVVIKDGAPLLIDWESATMQIGKISSDLYGAEMAGVKPIVSDSSMDYGSNGIWWGGPWDQCPGKYWGML